MRKIKTEKIEKELEEAMEKAKSQYKKN